MHSNINTLTFRKTVRVFHGLQVTVLSALVNGVKDYVIIMSFLPPAVYCDQKRLGVIRSSFWYHKYLSYLRENHKNRSCLLKIWKVHRRFDLRTTLCNNLQKYANHSLRYSILDGKGAIKAYKSRTKIKPVCHCTHLFTLKIS